MQNTLQKPRIQNYDKKVMAFEDKMKKLPGAVIGHDADERLCPLKHTFVDGAYIREIFMPAGLVLTSKIHKIKHPYFVMKGKCEVITDEGLHLIEAPYHGITEPGTKRILKILEDTIWITVHSTDSKDLAEIEKQIIAPSFDDPQLTNKDSIKIKGGCLCLG